MIDKIRTADEAIAGLQDGMTIMVGGFMACGSPENLMDAIVRKGVKHLTVIGNDGGIPPTEKYSARGIGKLINAGLVDRLIASHVGLNPQVGQGMMCGALACDLIPQGTLAEAIRAGGAGLGGVLTPTGVGTIAAEGRQIVVVDGKEYVLENPLKADYAFIRATHADKFGNFMSGKSTKTFNYVMAMAAETVVLGTEHLHEVGEKDADFYHMPGIFVDYIVGGEFRWQI
jgi:acetate CoA/acetoacetate CoA-transferase alpha subunit